MKYVKGKVLALLFRSDVFAANIPANYPEMPLRQD